MSHVVRRCRIAWAPAAWSSDAFRNCSRSASNVTSVRSAMASNYIDVARQFFLFAGAAKLSPRCTIVPPNSAGNGNHSRCARLAWRTKSVSRSREEGRHHHVPNGFRGLAPVINPSQPGLQHPRGAHTVIVDGDSAGSGTGLLSRRTRCVGGKSEERRRADGSQRIAPVLSPRWALV